MNAFNIADCTSWAQIHSFFIQLAAKHDPADTVLATDIDWTILHDPYRSPGETLSAVGWPAYPDAADTLKAIQMLGCQVIACTARPTGSAETFKSCEAFTASQLKDQGIQFVNVKATNREIASPSREFPRNASFYDGILFTSKRPKGPILGEWLRLEGKTPAVVLMIDDQLSHLESVAETIQRLFPSTIFIGIHYAPNPHPYPSPLGMYCCDHLNLDELNILKPDTAAPIDPLSDACATITSPHTPPEGKLQDPPLFLPGTVPFRSPPPFFDYKTRRERPVGSCEHRRTFLPTSPCDSEQCPRRG